MRLKPGRAAESVRAKYILESLLGFCHLGISLYIIYLFFLKSVYDPPVTPYFSPWCDAVLGLTRALKAVPSESRLAPALVGPPCVQAVRVVAALVRAGRALVVVCKKRKKQCSYVCRVAVFL